ncbi:MAG TPA: hypothetical protein VFH06_03340 [Candidatus Saccharimonadales bacterium]|nr:hypothetical protein [Candidatus Saccharimonadales bacterium]
MTAISNSQLATVKIRLGAGGLGVMVLGVIFFMLATNWDNQADRVAWTWMFIALGIAGVLGSLLIGRRSLLARVLLWVGIVIFVASIFALRIALTLTV